MKTENKIEKKKNHSFHFSHYRYIGNNNAGVQIVHSIRYFLRYKSATIIFIHKFELNEEEKEKHNLIEKNDNMMCTFFLLFIEDIMYLYNI